MRSVEIPVYTSKKLELFVNKRRKGFELWGVGVVKGQRVTIDHHLTRDNLEKKLCYAKRGDLIWRNAKRSEIPIRKHKLAIEMEETIERKVFWDGMRSNLSSILFLERYRKETAAARKAMLGRWTDGVVTFTMEPNNKLHWSCNDHKHWLNVGEQVHKQCPDWWNFSAWELGLFGGLGTSKACGTHVRVVHVDERELHIIGGPSNRIVRIFRKGPTVNQ